MVVHIMQARKIRHVDAIELSVLIVSYNTRELTLACIGSVLAETVATTYEIIVVDNASTDGSAEAIRAKYPHVRVEVPGRNLGFAAANNRASEVARGDLLLLLNPDTRVLDGAVDRLVAFSRKSPGARIWGGSTVFGDGSPNPRSCWSRPTPWSVFCRASGLSILGRNSRLFDPEVAAQRKPDVIREVDIVVGCFFLVSRSIWDELSGFDPRFFMYCEEADFCLRAMEIGARPCIDPSAVIVHLEGRSEPTRVSKETRMLKSKRLLYRKHFGPTGSRIALASLSAGVILRSAGYGLLGLVWKKSWSAGQTWRAIWANRREWRAEAGYESGDGGVTDAHPSHS